MEQSLVDTAGNRGGVMEKVVERDTVSPGAAVLELTMPDLFTIKATITGEAGTQSTLFPFAKLDTNGQISGEVRKLDLYKDSDWETDVTMCTTLTDKANNQSTETCKTIKTPIRPPKPGECNLDSTRFGLLNQQIRNGNINANFVLLLGYSKSCVTYDLPRINNDINNTKTQIQNQIEIEKQLSLIRGQLSNSTTSPTQITTLEADFDNLELRQYNLANLIASNRLVADYQTLNKYRDDMARQIDDCGFASVVRLLRSGNRTFDVDSTTDNIYNACLPSNANSYNYFPNTNTPGTIKYTLKSNLDLVKKDDPNILTKINFWLYQSVSTPFLITGSIALDFGCTRLTGQIEACSGASTAYYSITKTLIDYNNGLTQILDFGNVPLDTATGALGGYIGSRTVKFILGGKG